jgi:hypothetical protein
MVASTWITPGCVQFLKNKKRFHTAWTLSGLPGRRPASPSPQTKGFLAGVLRRKFLVSSLK